MKIEYSTALRDTVFSGYSTASFLKDLSAGIVISLISLPIAMALAIAVGIDPEHGIYTAIVAGLVAAIFGGSSTQVSGPTGAFVVVLIPIVMEFGLRGLILSQIMAGVFVVLMAIFRLGSLIRYVSYIVVVGFTAGIALTLFVISIKDFLGIKIGNVGVNIYSKIAAILQNLDKISYADSFIGILTIALILLWRRIKIKAIRVMPPMVMAVIIAGIVSYIMSLNGIEVMTIENNFNYSRDGLIYQGIPDGLPKFYFFGSDNELYKTPDISELLRLLSPAIIIAALVALESLLAAIMADDMSGYKHNSNSELFGIGLANILSGFSMGMPATGALARTATNIKLGARSPVSAIISSLLLCFYVFGFSKVINKIPMSSLSAILFITALNMAHIKEFKAILKNGRIHDVVVLLTAFSLTVMFDMIVGVSAGILVSSLAFVKRRGKTPPNLSIIEKEGEISYVIHGDIFFGNSNKIFSQFSIKDLKCQKLTLDLTNVASIDISSISGFKKLFNKPGATHKIHIKANDDIGRKMQRFLNLQKEIFE